MTVPDTVTLVNKTANSLEVDEAFDANATNLGNTGAAIAVNLDEKDFSASDTVIIEFDYTSTGLDCGSDSSATINHDMYVRFRKDSNGGISQLLIRKAHNDDAHGTTILYHGSSNTGELFEHNNLWLKAGEKLHLKIVSSPTQTDLYINGILIKQFAYPEGTTGAMPYLELYVRNGHYKFENISVRKVGGTIEDVTPLTDDNNLLAGEYGEIVSNIMAHNTLTGKSDSVVNGKVNFYTDMTWMNLSENGVESKYYNLAETFRYFGKNNSNYRMKSGESYVMSSIVRTSNGTLTDDDSQKHSSRINVSVGTYDGKQVWYYIEGTTLYSMLGSATRVSTVDLASEIGYQIGDYIRLTTVVSPYGYDVYIDVLKVYTYTVYSNTYIDYSNAYIGGSGAEVRFIDTAVWYNTANGELYKEELLKEVRTYETLSGIYLNNKTAVDAIAEEIKTACNNLNSTSNETLQEYVSVIDKLIASGRVVNNMVYDGRVDLEYSATSVSCTNPEDKVYYVDLAGDANSGWVAPRIPIFETSPFTATDTWTFEADVTCLADWDQQKRIGFSLQSSGDADVMIIDGTKQHNSDSVIKNLGNVNGTWKAGETWRVKYTVDPVDGIRTVIKNVATGAEVCDYNVAWSDLRATSKTTLVPHFYLANGDYEVRNVYA